MKYIVKNTYIVAWFDMFNVTCMTYWTNKVTTTTTTIKIDEYSDCISRKLLVLYDYCFYFMCILIDIGYCCMIVSL
jgi:dimeric dUTPase (all-alpha-NTP-PPase superfamily)